MSHQEEQKISIAYDVIEKYHENEDEIEFNEAIQDIIELEEAGFARGVFVSLQVIRGQALGGYSEAALEIAQELVEAIGGIEFLEDYLEEDSEVDAETIDWYKHVFG